MAEAPPEKQQTHYEVLRILPTASHDEIKAAFHALARQSHPDKQQQNVNINGNGHDSANNTSDDEQRKPFVVAVNAFDDFKRIQGAWEILREAERRQRYDEELQQQALRATQKVGAAMSISVDDDLAEAQDDETGELFHVYDCRCGEEIIIDVDPSSPQELLGLIDCPGCCFVYKLVAGQR
jgi:curved DNA-binding protein CbpA